MNYFRPETIGPDNTPMVARWAGIALAQAWGGGMVAAVDGMRFVVPSRRCAPGRTGGSSAPNAV